MANKLFKGFRQVTEGNYDAQEGYIYFVRPANAEGAEDGYLAFNGKRYGTAALLGAELRDLIGTLPQGQEDVVSYIESAIQAASHEHTNKTVLDGITEAKVTAWDNADPNTIEGIQVNGNQINPDASKVVNISLPDSTASGESNGVQVSVTASAGSLTDVTVTAPNFPNTYADKTGTEGRLDALEAVSADTRLDALEAISGDVHTHANKDLLDTYTQTEANLADAVAKKHEHTNKTVLDGITEAKVTAWDNATSDLSTLSGQVQTNETNIGNLESSLSAETQAREALSGRVDDLVEDIDAVSADTRISALEAVSAGTRISALESVSADTRLDALEAISGQSHTHANKDLLDTYTQTEANLADAVAKKHGHSNKSVLDGITAEDVAAWDSALQHVATGSTCVSVSESNGTATVDIVLSQDTGNALEKKADGLYAAIYYDGDDTNMPE